jgi:hypothetical protein
MLDRASAKTPADAGKHQHQREARGDAGGRADALGQGADEAGGAQPDNGRDPAGVRGDQGDHATRAMSTM